MGKRILGIVGSYRRNGTIDSLVQAVLSAAEEQGAETDNIYLIDKHIEFCTNCRTCTQKPGTEHSECVHRDDLAGILDRYDTSDGFVIGAPVNCFNLNAITRRFMERLMCLTYWPWGKGGYVLSKKSPGQESRSDHLERDVGDHGQVLFRSSARAPRYCGDAGRKADRFAFCGA